ncbi:MAG: prephenate dehydrogenase [Spirochaeta sp. LUC14_002_19_P3]|nr:MAG: prephenate dehydrogenase [Spirochaeta sp. LUC14_002_19_P3]
MTLGIYGLGRFGAWWAGELGKVFEVCAYSRSPERICPPRVRRVSEEELLSTDVIILCPAISALENVLRRIAPRLKPDTLVMDTCSVKVHPSRAMLSILPETVHILGTHPMFGPDSAANGLRGLPLVYSPLRMPDSLADLWRAHFQSLGLKIIEMSPEQHDREAARTQGITHFIGRVLGEMKLASSPIATTGYKRLLDIIAQTCHDPWQLFCDLQNYNQYTAQIREELHTAIEKMMKQLNIREDM